ncbi:uncharacterized protein LOC115448694 [Manduca sexta]|nr:uncharacterized protein LOC115448694 [Manduca sexta]
MHDKIKYLIIVPDHLETECKDDFIDVGNKVAYYDVTFIFNNNEEEDNTETYTISTFIREVDEATCKEIVHGFININNCQNGILESNIVFPNKNPTNIKNCPLNIGMGTLYPFSIIQDRDILKTFDKLNESQIRGSDLELVKIAAKQFNATLNYNYVRKKEENPIGQYDFIPFIMNGSLDICAGGFYRIYGDVVSYSGIYARQAVKWMYTADRKDKSWQNLVHKVNGLYIFIIYYVAYSCVWWLIRKFDKQSVSATTTLIFAWGALVGAGSLQDTRSLKQKIVNLMYLIMCLHLSAYIAAQLYSFYTISEPPERLETINDIMESGRPTYLVPVVKYFVIDENFRKYANQSKECDTFYDCFEKSLIYKGMTLLLHAFFANYQAKSAVGDEARILCTTQNVLTVYYEMLIRKNSPYVSKYQDIIVRLFEAGIPEKLYIEAIGLTVVGRAESASKNIIANSYSCQTGCTVTIRQLDGAFYICDHLSHSRMCFPDRHSD